MLGHFLQIKDTGILWSADRKKYHDLGYKFYLSGPRMEVSLGPEFAELYPFECCLGLLLGPEGEGDIVAIPTAPETPLGFYDLLGEHWREPFFADYIFTRLDKASPPIRLECWEGPADLLSVHPYEVVRITSPRWCSSATP